MGSLAIEDDEDAERDPVVADDEGGVEDGVLEELHHALAGLQVAVADEVLPPEDADEEDERGDDPRDDDHGDDLAAGAPCSGWQFNKIKNWPKKSIQRQIEKDACVNSFKGNTCKL